MKMKMLGFENDILFDDAHVNVLEIEDTKFFSTLAYNLNEIVNDCGAKEDIMLMEDDKVIDIKKNTLLIIDLFNIDFNNKKITSDLYAKMENLFSEEYSNSITWNEVQSKATYLIQQIIQEFPLKIEYKESITFQDLLKLYGMKIDMNQAVSLLEKILLVMDILQVFNLYKLIIFFNLKSFLLDEEIEEVYKYAKYKKLNLLLVEPKLHERLLIYEKKLIVDKYFQDYIVNL